MRSEVLTLRLSQVDLKAGTLRLEPGMTKNDAGRLVDLTPEPGAAPRWTLSGGALETRSVTG